MTSEVVDDRPPYIFSALSYFLKNNNCLYAPKIFILGHFELNYANYSKDSFNFGDFVAFRVKYQF